MCKCLTACVCVPVTEPGPPSPPDSVTVEEVTDSTAQLAWSRGRDNGSPIANYFIQTRTPFTVGWQRVNTGGQHATTVVRMDPRGEIFAEHERSERRVSCGMKGQQSGFKVFLGRAVGQCCCSCMISFKGPLTNRIHVQLPQEPTVSWDCWNQSVAEAWWSRMT